MPPIFRDLAGAGGRAGRLCRLRARCLPDQPLRARRAACRCTRTATRQNYDAPIVSVSLGLPAIFLFGGLKRIGQAGALPAGAWRCRGLGRAVAAVLSWRGAARRWRACAAWPPAHQSDLPESAVAAAGLNGLPHLQMPRLCIMLTRMTDDRAHRGHRATAATAPGSISRSCNWCSRWAGPPM